MLKWYNQKWRKHNPRNCWHCFHCFLGFRATKWEWTVEWTGVYTLKTAMTTSTTTTTNTRILKIDDLLPSHTANNEMCFIFRTEYFENKYWMWKFQNKSNLIQYVQYLLYHSQSLFGPNMKQFQYIHVKNFSQGPLLKTCYTKTIKGQLTKQDHGNLNFIPQYGS